MRARRSRVRAAGSLPRAPPAARSAPRAAPPATWRRLRPARRVVCVHARMHAHRFIATAFLFNLLLLLYIRIDVVLYGSGRPIGMTLPLFH